MSSGIGNEIVTEAAVGMGAAFTRGLLRSLLAGLVSTSTALIDILEKIDKTISEMEQSKALSGAKVKDDPNISSLARDASSNLTKVNTLIATFNSKVLPRLSGVVPTGGVR